MIRFRDRIKHPGFSYRSDKALRDSVFNHSLLTPDKLYLSLLERFCHNFNNMFGLLTCAVFYLMATTEAARDNFTLVFSDGGEESAFTCLHADVIMAVAERACHTAAARVNFIYIFAYPAQDSFGGVGSYDGALLAVPV